VTPRHHPVTGEFVNSSVDFADDLEELEEDSPLDEFDDEYEGDAYQPPPPPVPASRPVPIAPPRTPAVAPTPAPAPTAPIIDSGFSDRLRLQTIKGYGRSAMPWNLPPEWQGRVIADLERYVTPTQFPADLDYAKAAEIVRARVAEVLRPYTDAEEKAARQKKAREEAERCRAALLAHGSEYARRETSDWAWSASHEARDEVKKVLEREVEHDWTEREVEGVVDQVLDEWDDDEDDELDDDG
jgi:hypothetical protein